MLVGKEILIILGQDESAGGIFTAKYQITMQKFRKASKTYGQSRENEAAGLTRNLRNG